MTVPEIVVWATHIAYLLVVSALSYSAVDVYWSDSELDLPFNHLPYIFLLLHALARILIETLNHNIFSIAVYSVGAVASLLALIYFARYDVLVVSRKEIILILSVVVLMMIFYSSQLMMALMVLWYSLSLALMCSPLFALQDILRHHSNILLPWYHTASLSLFTTMSATTCAFETNPLGILVFLSGLVITSIQFLILFRFHNDDLEVDTPTRNKR